MASTEIPDPEAIPPIELKGTRIDAVKGAAAGIKAVASTVAFSYREMGVVRGTKMLLQINQKDGFDCQSCAWPSPDGDRHVAEFCENGAKAVADEADDKAGRPGLFSRSTACPSSRHGPITGSGSRGD